MAGQASALEQGCVCAWYSSRRRLKLFDHGDFLPVRLRLKLLGELVLSGWRWCPRLVCVTWLLSVFLYLPTNQYQEEADSLSSTPELLLQRVLFRCFSQHQQTSTPLGTLSSLVALGVIRVAVMPAGCFQWEGEAGKGEPCCKQLCYRCPWLLADLTACSGEWVSTCAEGKLRKELNICLYISQAISYFFYTSF